MESNLLSVLLIHPRIYLHVLIVYRLLLGILLALLCPAHNRRRH